jgi:type I restriction enzyme S subunit
VTDLALKECHLPRVQPGSVLVAITGQGKTRGTAAVLTFEASINQHLAFITPRGPAARSEYLQLALAGAYPELRRISDDSGSTKGALTCGDISHFRIALPPPEEQLEIITKVKRSIDELSVAVERTQGEIGLASEYRTRLIADVVTGKLDVRGAAARLSDEIEEPLDEAELATDDDEPGGADADAVDEAVA